MKWRGRRESQNVQDRRGQGPSGRMVGGGIGGIGLIIVIIIALINGDPGAIFDQLGNSTGSNVNETVITDERQDELASFVKVVLADTEDVWHEKFNEMNRSYQEPRLVLFSGSVQSACGIAGSATGPFYCPGDQQVYIDLSFYDELKNRFNAPGDAAMAYVVAHEVGHHVQTLLGITDQVMPLRQQMSETEFNQYLMRFELQADYLAGVWAKYVADKGYFDKSDVEDAMRAAHAVGDDNIQKQAQGYVVPDSFTHGTSEQRVRWFMKGYENGDLGEWDTFNANNL